MSLKYETEDGQSHEAVVVHKAEAEGALVIDRMTGMILSPIADRPDWSEGYACAILSEHRQFYTSRLGTYAEPELFAADDLGWIAVNHEGDEMEIDADAEHRMEVLAARLGIDRETGDVEATMREIELSHDHLRDPEDVSAIERSKEEGFAATGTH